ncbi:MAG: hypothetical protein P8O70_10290 [SAR324 cluster bacterium]|nr:hypothetical protein [SAR324 cluster bacterium]
MTTQIPVELLQQPGLKALKRIMKLGFLKSFQQRKLDLQHKSNAEG